MRYYLTPLRMALIKKSINKMKRQPSEWKKITAKEATDKGLNSRIYKQLMHPRPWDSQGKNIGVGCHFLLQCMKVKSEK